MQRVTGSLGAESFAAATADLPTVFVLGLAVPVDALLFNAAAVVHEGRVCLLVRAEDQVARIIMTADQTAATLELAKGKSAIVELPSEVRDLLVTSPAVADAVLRDRRRVLPCG